MHDIITYYNIMLLYFTFDNKAFILWTENMESI